MLFLNAHLEYGLIPVVVDVELALQLVLELLAVEHHLRAQLQVRGVPLPFASYTCVQKPLGTSLTDSSKLLRFLSSYITTQASSSQAASRAHHDEPYATTTCRARLPIERPLELIGVVLVVVVIVEGV